jgi:ribosomal protein S21
MARHSKEGHGARVSARYCAAWRICWYVRLGHPRTSLLTDIGLITRELGRSIRVKSGNLASALQAFTQRLRQNRVMQDFRYQMRHEKKGVKRRRLQSERWRRQFANVVSP